MVLNNPVDRKKFLEAVQEGSNALTRIAGERDLLKDIVDSLSKDFDIPKRTINKVIRTHFKQSYTEESSLFEEFSELYESINGGGS